MNRFFPIVIGTFFLFAGCSLVPSNWKLFGTPITRLEKNEKKEDAVRDRVYEKSRELAHKEQAALAKAAPSREVEVAKDFNDELVALLDQARGPAILSDLAKWQNEVDRLCSEDLAIRAKADLQRAKERGETEKLSAKLAEAEARTERAEAKATQYAKEKEAQANFFLKIIWAVGAVFGIWLLFQMLSIAAKFMPALAPFAAVANGILAPAVAHSLSRATDGLKKIGHGMSEIRDRIAPEVALQVEEILDKHADEDHKKAIGAAAASAPR